MCMEDIRLGRQREYRNGGVNITVAGGTQQFLGGAADRVALILTADQAGVRIIVKSRASAGADVQVMAFTNEVRSQLFRIEDYGLMLCGEWYAASLAIDSALWFTEVTLEKQ